MLRVVSTDAGVVGPGGDSESYLTLREADSGLARSVASRGSAGRARAGRFVGNTGYVVTFRQIDPLYTVDLADPGTRACSAS